MAVDLADSSETVERHDLYIFSVHIMSRYTILPSDSGKVSFGRSSIQSEDYRSVPRDQCASARSNHSPPSAGRLRSSRNFVSHQMFRTFATSVTRRSRAKRRSRHKAKCRESALPRPTNAGDCRQCCKLKWAQI